MYERWDLGGQLRNFGSVLIPEYFEIARVVDQNSTVPVKSGRFCSRLVHSRIVETPRPGSGHTMGPSGTSLVQTVDGSTHRL